MREDLIRGCFSALASAVFVATSAEWALWAIEQRRPWKFVPALFLAALSIYETAKVWKHIDRLITEVA